MFSNDNLGHTPSTWTSITLPSISQIINPNFYTSRFQHIIAVLFKRSCSCLPLCVITPAKIPRSIHLPNLPFYSCGCLSAHWKSSHFPLLTTIASVKNFTFRLNHHHMYVDFFVNSFYTVVNNFQLIINITEFLFNITYFANILFNIVVNCINFLLLYMIGLLAPCYIVMLQH